MSDPTVLPRLRARRGAVARSDTWWGRAFVRSAEETAYHATDLTTARSLARSGRLGAVMVLTSFASVVVDGPPGLAGDTAMAQLKVAPLDDWDGLVAEAAREAGFVAALESGELPADLLEHADQAGIELLPEAGDLESACSCEAWTQPCVHALALTYQLAWQIDRDPYLLLLLRGRTREWLLEQVRAAVAPTVPPSPDLAEASALAVQILALAQDAPTGDGLHAAAVAAYDEEVAQLLSSGCRARPGPAAGRPPAEPGLG